MTLKKKGLAILAGLALTLTGCSESEQQDSPDSASSSSSADNANKMGKLIEGKGVSINVEEAFTSSTYDKIVKTSSSDSIEQIEGREDGQFVVVKTVVRNDHTEEMDLTCGFGVQAEVITDKGSHYTPVQELYAIPGNPECNANLGTDFDTQMTWVFEIPKTHKPIQFGFANPEVAYDDLTLIELDKLSDKPKDENSDSEDGPKPTEAASDNDQTGASGQTNSATTQEQQAPTNAASPAPQNAPQQPTYGSPNYGVACDPSLAGQPGVGTDGSNLVCLGGPGGSHWVYGPEPSGETVDNGQECVDGESGAQDANGVMMMCVGGQWMYGP